MPATLDSIRASSMRHGGCINNDAECEHVHTVNETGAKISIENIFCLCLNFSIDFDDEI